MKFKIGDKVRIVGISGLYKLPMDADIEKRVVGFACNSSYRRGYVLEGISPGAVWFDDELELVKEKFDPNNYCRSVMHCSTFDQAWTFCKLLHAHGFKWSSGITYLHKTNYDAYKDKTCYNWQDGTFCDTDEYIKDGYTILEFDNFDWSDFTVKKEFTKKDLKNGDVIKKRNGTVEIVCADTGTLICKSGWNALSDINNDLTDVDSCDDCDIVAVRRPTCASDCQFDAFSSHRGRLVYERKEPEEMTLEEVCKALGKEIKIVKSK